MPSFATLSILTTLAFAGYTSAAPVSAHAVGVLPVAVGEAHVDARAEIALNGALPHVVGEADIEARVDAELKGALEHIAAGEAELETRAEAELAGTLFGAVGEAELETRNQVIAALPTIINTATGKLAPVVATLQKIQPAGATLEAISPMTAQITDILNEAMSAANGLAGKPLDQVLATADGVMSVTDAAKLMTGMITMVSNGLGYVQTVASAEVKSALAPALTSVGNVMTMVNGLEGGIMAAAAPLLAPTVSVLQNLGLTDVINGVSLPL